jgi:cation transport protein ChaC
MSTRPDPFVHHPELRGEIADPLGSYFRSFTIDELAAKTRQLGLPGGWWHSDAEREAMRDQTLAGHRDEDLWVFAYGSLMWDPGVRFTEVRRARISDHARRFILKDIYGGRGTREAPGIMAALDTGAGCEGLAFRIAKDHIEEETQVLWRREIVGPAYLPAFVETAMADGVTKTLTFVADHDAEIIDGEVSRADQIRFLATGAGFLGTSLDYLKNIDRKFAALGIYDEEVTSLLRDTLAYIDGSEGG